MTETAEPDGLASEADLRNTVLVGLLIAYLPTYLSPALRVVGIEFGPRGPPSVVIWNWVAVTVLLAYVSQVEGRGFDSILLVRPSGRDVLWAGLFGLTGIVWQMVASTLLSPSPGNTETLLAYPLSVIVALVLTTATTEEILFRGYVIERLTELTGRLWLAVGCSAVAFAVPHVTFFGSLWLVTNVANVALLYALYVWRRNLVACMLAHLIGNSLLLVPALGLA